MGLGTGLRNTWGLWGDSRLAHYFKQLGVNHPDDMSGIILATFWCKLHDKPFRLKQKIAYYQEYWRKEEKPKATSPKDGAKIAWLITIGGVEGPILHLGISTSDHSYWRYESGTDRGIEPATLKDTKELDDLRKSWQDAGATVEDLLRQCN